MAREGVINLLGRDSKKAGSVRVRLAFDVPDEMLEMLLTDISQSVEHWEDKVVAHGNIV